MKSSKFIQVMSTFSDKEFKEFEKTAVSYFYKNEKMLSFIEFIVFHYPGFEEESISKLNAFRFVYTQGEDFEDIRIREMLSALNKVLKDFLVLNQIKTSDFYYELDLLKQYKRRDLESLYQSQLKTVKSKLKKDKFKNKEFYKRSFLLASVENEHFTAKHIRALDQHIQIKLNNLDYFYFATKLKETCEMLNRQRLLNQQYELNLFEEIEDIIDKNRDAYLNQATIVCYYEIYKLLTTNDDKNQLQICLDTLNKNAPNFSGEELKAMYDFPQNYCIAQVNKGNENYTEVLFDLQTLLVDKTFNMVNGFISQVSYRNIVTIALKLKKFEFSKKFIEDFKSKVAPEFRENTYNMNKANLYYSLEEYHKTISLLNQVEFTDTYYAYYSKVILLKTYYALAEFETLSYFITAFKLNIKRNKELPPLYKKGADLFLSNFKKIFNIAEKIDFLDAKKVNEKLNQIAQDVNAEKNIHNRAWLLEIIENLRK